MLLEETHRWLCRLTASASRYDVTRRVTRASEKCICFLLPKCLPVVSPVKNPSPYFGILDTMPNRRVSLRVVFWQEGLPQIAFVMILCYIQSLLDHHPCASPISKLYIWTAIWSIASLVSLLLLVGTGPTTIATLGLSFSFKMLLGLYDSIGDPCGKAGIYEVGTTDIFYAGSFVILVFAVASYLTTHWNKPSLQADEGDPMEEKA